jgi:8-oxo-dGTP pyrophosphatase MutT (NUDIX family)
MNRLALFAELSAALSARERAILGPPEPGVRPASVLVPFYEDAGAPHLLFLKRPEGEYRHAGQVAFPGGKREEGETALACALREAHEEVGLEAKDVEVLGELDEYDTVVTSFRVTPIVARIPFPYPLRPDPREVEKLLYVPLSKLLDPRILREEKREAFGRTWKIGFYDVGPDPVWGVTAGMLGPLLEIVRALPCMATATGAA